MCSATGMLVLRLPIPSRGFKRQFSSALASGGMSFSVATFDSPLCLLVLKNPSVSCLKSRSLDASMSLRSYLLSSFS